MAGCAVGCRDEATSVPVSSGIAEAGLLRRIHFLAETADFLAELSSHAKELLQRDAVERATGQFVFDIFLRPEQAGQFLFTGGGQFFLGGFLQHGPERCNFGGLLVAPFDEGALGDAEFAGGVVEAPALCSEFDEFVYFFRCVHTFTGCLCLLSSMRDGVFAPISLSFFFLRFNELLAMRFIDPGTQSAGVGSGVCPIAVTELRKCWGAVIAARCCHSSWRRDA